MKVTVFGGSGFLGSHVADVLTEAGHKVIIFDQETSAYLQNGQEMIVGDVRDRGAVRKAVEGCDIVYNFSALSDIDEANVKPVETAEINIIGNVNILDAAKEANVNRFVFSSSIYVYSDAGSFYRSSKQACELYVENYQKVFGLDYTIVRYGSLYGSRSDERNWIYRILKQALTEKRIIREGDGEEIREYIHVQDAAKLTVDILDDQYKNRPVIITGNEQIKIKDLLKMVQEILKNEVEVEFVPSKHSQHYEITPYVFNPQMATKISGNEHLDMGQGILHILSEIHKKYVASNVDVSKT